MEPNKPAENKKVYRNPALATDAICTKIIKEEEHVLLITRGRDPFKGHYAFPGGFVDYGEDPEVGVTRELAEECNIEGAKPQLVCVAGKPDRDPRQHVVSIVYHVHVDPEHMVKASDDAATAEWYPLAKVLAEFDMAFDHKEIL